MSMLEFLTPHAEGDAIEILKKDHSKVKDLFDQFEKAEDTRTKKRIVAEAVKELKIHAAIEEEIFYAVLRKQKVETDILNEADEEHHVAKLLIAELDQMNGSEDHYEAKFIVLAENIRHHIKEEEGQMFPEARTKDVDFEAVGAKMLARKRELLKNGIPASAEEKMIHAHKKGSGDSPAQNARKVRNIGLKPHAAPKTTAKKVAGEKR